jgi:hypothetical protein
LTSSMRTSPSDRCNESRSRFFQIEDDRMRVALWRRVAVLPAGRCRVQRGRPQHYRSSRADRSAEPCTCGSSSPSAARTLSRSRRCEAAVTAASSPPRRARTTPTDDPVAVLSHLRSCARPTRRA